LDRRYRGNIDDIGAILQAIDVLGAPTVQTPPVTFQFDNEGILIQE
jgi:hypothetical protein